MVGYERTYGTGRFVAAVLEFIGWLIVACGTIMILAGLSSGGILGMASRQFGQQPDALQRILASLPGLFTLAGGLYAVMQAQSTKATLDSAELARESFNLARARQASAGTQIGSPVRKEPTIRSPESITSTSTPKAFPGDVVETYQGWEIKKEVGGYSVSHLIFRSLEDARNWVENEGPKSGS